MERLTDRKHDCMGTFCTNTKCELYEACPAIERNNRLAEYEETGLTPEQVKALDENARTSLLTWFAEKYGFPVGELMDILEAKQEGRLKIVKKPPEGAVCGNCGDFIRTEGTARGTCRTQHRKRLGSKNELRSVAQSTKACEEFYAGKKNVE